MTDTGVTQVVAIYNYLENHPGDIFGSADIAEALGIPPDNVNACLSRAVREQPWRGITRPERGKYMYRPDAGQARQTPREGPKPGDLFEVVGSTTDAVVIVRDPVTFQLFRLEIL